MFICYYVQTKEKTIYFLIQVQHINHDILNMSKVGYRIGPHFQKGYQIDKKKI